MEAARCPWEDALVGDAVDVVDAVDVADGAQDVAEVLGVAHFEVKRLIATRSLVVWTLADRMLTCWSDRIRVTSESSRVRSSASTWMATRKTEASDGAQCTLDHPLELGVAQVREVHAVRRGARRRRGRG